MRKFGGIKKAVCLCIGAALAVSLAGTTYAASFMNRMGNVRLNDFVGDVKQLQNGEYVIAAKMTHLNDWNNGYAAFLKLDAAGDLVMAKEFIQGGEGTALEVMPDGRILFLAQTPNWSCWVGIIDPADGSVDVQTAFGMQFGAMKIVGNYAYLFTDDLKALKLDLNNNLAVVASKSFVPLDDIGNPRSYRAIYSNVAADTGGNLYLTGKLDDTGSVFVFKVDPSFTTPVMKSIDNSYGSSWSYWIEVFDTDNKMVLVGSYGLNSGGHDNGWVLGLSGSFAKDYERTIDGPAEIYCDSVATYGGSPASHVVGCSAQSYLPRSRQIPVAVKITENEHPSRNNIAIDWQSGFTTPDAGEMGSVITTSDGGAMLLGGAWDFGGATTVVKTDSSGQIIATDGGGNPVANPFIIDPGWTVSSQGGQSTIGNVSVDISDYDPLPGTAYEMESDVTDIIFDRIVN